MAASLASSLLSSQSSTIAPIALTVLAIVQQRPHLYYIHLASIPFKTFILVKMTRWSKSQKQKNASLGIRARMNLWIGIDSALPKSAFIFLYSKRLLNSLNSFLAFAMFTMFWKRDKLEWANISNDMLTLTPQSSETLMHLLVDSFLMPLDDSWRILNGFTQFTSSFCSI